MHPLFTIREAEQIIQAGIKARSSQVIVSLDLGLTQSVVEVKDNVLLVGQQRLPLAALKKIKEEACYILVNNELRQVSFFSEETKRYYKLIPTKDWPTLALSSTPMHRHTKISPKEDTFTKIKEISPQRGKILDTCCGLGYTAIVSAQAERVLRVDTFEQDENVLRIAEFNPYSRELFEKEKIILHQGKNIAEEIKKMDSNSFDRIIHDPPTFKYSPELYTLDFYRQLYRVLAKKGWLYHYAPHPHKTKGVLFYPKIISNLRKAGFKKVAYHQVSSGIRAEK